MSPRPGGEADKFGNRFEGCLTATVLLDVLSGEALSVVLEERGEQGKGVEFCVERPDGAIEVHQVKRQNGDANGWTLARLREIGVLEAAARQVALGRRFEFSSIVPARPLDELTDQARRSDDVAALVSSLSDKGRRNFDEVVTVCGSRLQAFAVLRFVWVSWPDERRVNVENARRAGELVEGAPPGVVPPVLGAIAWNNLGLTLDRELLERALQDHGLTPRSVSGSTTRSPNVASVQPYAVQWWRTSPVTTRLLTMTATVLGLVFAAGIFATLQPIVAPVIDGRLDELFASPPGVQWPILSTLVGALFFMAVALRRVTRNATQHASRWSMLPVLTGWGGRLGLARLRAECVYCGGDLKFKAVPATWIDYSDGTRKVLTREFRAVCKRNPNHTASIDPAENVV